MPTSRNLDPDRAAEDYARLLEECRLADEALAAAAYDSLDAIAVTKRRGTTEVSLRWIYVHMIEEYARHNGHADLLRESIDGRTGA